MAPNAVNKPCLFCFVVLVRLSMSRFAVKIAGDPSYKMAADTNLSKAAAWRAHDLLRPLAIWP